MDTLCFSTYATAIKAALKEVPANETVADLLFNSIALPVSLMNKAGDPFGVTKETASKLFNRLQDVPRKIRESASNPKVTSSIYSYFEKSVLPRISPGLEDDLLLRLSNIIESDNSISSETKKQFIDKAQKNTLAEFLANVFLYTVKKGNKLPQLVTSTEIIPHVVEQGLLSSQIDHGLRLLLETKGYCPNNNCAEPLFITKNGKSQNWFKATRIRLDRPADQFENLIALCPKCHDEYVLAPSTNETQRLESIKVMLMRESLAKEAASEIKIEAEIADVIHKIASPEVEPVPLNYEPKTIKEKILKENRILLGKTLFHVNTYFNYVKDIFQQMSKEGKIRFEAFSTQVRLCYLKERDNGLSQQEIYAALVEWLRSVTNGSRDACEIVIAYFVQNCEVFDAITE